ncbi:MAG: hypothetical protein KatS3mg057_3096 [Herpetosiphonaceae bacterium]|nr:MAG: hypothetical protein KatS3mg057_3096 [Herpetosiphonaceae bacterium]
MHRSQLNLQRVWRTALMIIGGLIVVTLLLQVLGASLPRAAGIVHSIILAIKFLIMAALLASWALLNIPPPQARSRTHGHRCRQLCRGASRRRSGRPPAR